MVRHLQCTGSRDSYANLQKGRCSAQPQSNMVESVSEPSNHHKNRDSPYRACPSFYNCNQKSASKVIKQLPKAVIDVQQEKKLMSMGRQQMPQSDNQSSFHINLSSNNDHTDRAEHQRDQGSSQSVVNSLSKVQQSQLKKMIRIALRDSNTIE